MPNLRSAAVLSRAMCAVVLVSCNWLAWADEPAKAEKVDAPAAESPLKARLGERLKQLRAKRDGANPAAKSEKEAGEEGGFAERIKQLRGKLGGGGELDMTKFERKTWKVGEVEREALVYAPPAKEGKTDSKAKRPLVFAFHGHGGTMEHSAKRMAFHEMWPDAVSVYPQGLPTAVPVIDVNGRMPGWQKYVGDQNDRDLAFFDAMLQTMLAEQQVDENRVYACGHSNGGFFCYVLLPARGDKLAAIAPIAGALNPRDYKDIAPLPVFHVAGERDPLVKYDMQVKVIEHIKQINGCNADGKPAGEHCTAFTSAGGPPVVAYLHPGSHEIPRPALPMITEFFQQNVRKPAAVKQAAK